jgi:hypothetical protein
VQEDKQTTTETTKGNRNNIYAHQRHPARKNVVLKLQGLQSLSCAKQSAAAGHACADEQVRTKNSELPTTTINASLRAWQTITDKE